MNRLLAAVLSASLCLTAPTSMVFAQDVAAEDAQFNRLTAEASEAYEAGDYKTAVARFEEAYALKSVSNILYNIARIYEDAGDIDQAIAYYDKFVVAPNVESGARKDALERLKTLREVKAMQEAENAPPEVVVEQPQPDPEPVEPERPKTARTVGWIMLGTGGAALAASGIFGLLAQGEFDDFETATTVDARRQAASSGKTNSVVADSLLIGGLVTASVGGILLILSSGKSDKKAKASKPVRVSPIVGSAWGAGLDFSF